MREFYYIDVMDKETIENIKVALAVLMIIAAYTAVFYVIFTY